MLVRVGPGRRAATTVTVVGVNLAGVTEVDFGTGNPGAIITARSASSVTVRTPASPTGGWDDDRR